MEEVARGSSLLGRKEDSETGKLSDYSVIGCVNQA